jgi:hypothetical protein
MNKTTKKIFLVALLSAISSGAVVALVTKSFECNFRVVAAEGLKLWNLEGTEELTTLAFGDLNRGTVISKQFCIQNLGDKDVTILMSTDEQIEWLTVTWSFDSPIPAHSTPATLYKGTITVTIAANAPMGTDIYLFHINVDAAPV